MRRTGLGMRLSRAAVAALLGFAAAALGQSSDEIYPFKLGAQSVGSALRVFGEVTHQQIIFSEATVKGRRSGAVVGSFTAAQALNLLLAGTGLKITRTEAGVFYIENGAAP